MATINFDTGGVSITGALQSQAFRLVDNDGNSTLDLTNLQQQLQQIQQGLTDEITARGDADSLIETSINSVQINLTQETLDRQGADNTLQSNIDAEVSARQSADSSLQNSINLKAPINNPVFQGTVGGITKAMVGLDQVDNVSDFNKPLSTAAVAALALKADLSKTLYANTWFVNAGVNTLTSVINSIGAAQDQTVILSSSTHNNASDSSVAITLNNFTLLSVDGASVQPATLSGAVTLNGSTQTRVRVSNIQFNSVFTVSGTAGRHNFRSCNFTAGFTLSGATTNWIQFDNCSFAGTVTVPSTFAGSITFFRCDFLGATLSFNNASPLQIVMSTCSSLPSFSLNAVISGLNGTSSTTQLNVAQAVFSGTVSGITKTMVGLSNVDNTSDANKPISTATQTALNAKQNTLTFDTTPTSSSSNPITSGGVFTALSSKADTSALSNYATTSALTSGLATKQNTLTFDTTPTSSSTNPVTSGGVFSALATKADTSALSSYATTSALTSGLAGKQNTLTSTTGITVQDINCRDIYATGVNCDFANVDADLTVAGAVLLSSIPVKTSETNVLYYDTTSKSVSYGTAPTGSGGGSITIDSTPTSGSTNAVSSGGVFSALAAKANTSDLSFYATTSALTSGLAGKQNTLTSTSDITVGSINVTGDLNVDGNLIDSDPVNNRVGINKNTPAYTLDVNGDVSATSYLVGTNTTNVVRRYALTLASGGAGQSTYTTQGTAWNYGIITWHSVAAIVGNGGTYNDFGWSSGSTITVPVNGLYMWQIHSNLNPSAAINMTFIMRVNGSTEYRYNLNAGASASLPSSQQPAFASGVNSLAASTTLDFGIRTGSTNTDLRTNTDFTRIFLTIVRVG